MKYEKLKPIINRLYPFVALGIFVSAWAVVAAIVNVEMIMPAPSRVIGDFFSLVVGDSFWRAVFNTLTRALLSFGISFILALILAVAGYFLPPVYKLLSPIVVIIRSVPTMSIILIAVIWLTSYLSPIFVTSLIIFPLLFAAFYDALVAIPNEFSSMSKIYKVRWQTRIARLYIPAILPNVFSVSKSTISLALKIMIASEVLAQTRTSMGDFMQVSRIYLDTSMLFAWTIAAVLLSFLLELLVVFIRKMVIKWEK